MKRSNVAYQVMWNRLISVVEEQAQALVRTAFSTSVREAGDLSAGVYDVKGQMLAQAVTGTPGHVNAMADAVAHFIRRIGRDNIYEGDVYITNDPWEGTGHLHDITMVTPSFYRKELVGFFACTAHIVDIGGRGFGADAASIYEEGLYLPIMKFAERGQVDQTLLKIVRGNVREPDQLIGDIYALSTCNEIGHRRLTDMMQEFDISDLKRPQQVGAVQTCRGSHTHSVVSGPDENGIIIVYNSGTSSVRDQEELESCFEAIPGDNRTALFRIDVIEIPVADPSQAKIVKSPTVFADPETGALAGLWRGGDHGDDTQDTSRTDECHDITVFPSKNLAAGACSGNGILFDISDPYNPRRLDVVTDVGFAYWHSATFNNEGTKIIFTDEWGGGGRARCRAWDPLDWGANAIYDIVNNKLEFRSHYKMPAPQLETENCVAHNGSLIPIPNKDVLVQAWYQGGISIMDFTDSANPKEIAFFDRGPIDEELLVMGGYWSAYYYDGFIYGTEISRGLDVFKLSPSEYLSEKEILEASKAQPLYGPKVFNPQQQVPLGWSSGY